MNTYLIQKALVREIVNNKVTLVLLYLLVLSYLILRDSFKKYLLFNVLWFGLFVAYQIFSCSSVDGNIFNILPSYFFL